ncbi:MAG: carboxy terminal-processing peptidase [Saprospiraceae bacterium]
MAYRSSIILVALFGLLFYTKSKETNLVDPNKEALILQGILQSVEYVHYNPKPIDDVFSQAVYNSYLERLDISKRFLTQEDLATLEKYRLLIDDQVNQRDFEFFNLTLPMIDAGITKAKTYFNGIIDTPLDFDKAGEYQMDAEKRSYAKNDTELKEEWKRIITYDVMSLYVQNLEKQKDAKDGDRKTDQELRDDAVKQVKKRINDWFDRLSKLRRSDRIETYFGSIANYFDPHTDYFSPKEKEDFDISMGGKLEGIGARLQTEGDYTKVYSIVVGGPAWKTKQLEENDIILKVAQKGNEAVDIAGMRVDDVVQLVRGKKGTVVILTVKKIDNSIADIEIERDEVQLDDSKAKSVLIDMPGKIEKVGYIYLPKFYNSFDDGGNSCAYDVAQEIKKLKAMDISGIILDLRNNSGGSLNDVVEMSGLFIEDGPIVQVKDRRSKALLHEDKDKSVLYTGPFIIMVNHFSASASEIIAAAMQDYGRAIIVGSNSTFGKGTVQRFFDLDQGIRGYNEFKPLGNTKITVQKFYRINGGSTQLKGVIPDIILPDTYQYIETGEKEYDNPLEWTEIAAVPYKQNVVLLEHKDKVIQASNARIANNPQFNLILEGAKQLKENREKSLYPLRLNDYRAMINRRNEESKKYDGVLKNEIEGMVISNLPADMDKINLDESNKARNDEFIGDLRKDIYLEETMHIMRDMIMVEKSFVSLQPRINQDK